MQAHGCWVARNLTGCLARAAQHDLHPELELLAHHRWQHFGTTCRGAVTGLVLVVVADGELGGEVALGQRGDVLDEEVGCGQHIQSGGDGAVVAAQRDDLAGQDLGGGRRADRLQHAKRADDGVALPNAPAVAPGMLADDIGAVAGEVTVLLQRALPHHLNVGSQLEQRQLHPRPIVETGPRWRRQPIAVAGRVYSPLRWRGQRGGPAFEDHVGEEELLAVAVRRREVRRPSWLLLVAGLLEAEAAGQLVADLAASAAEGAGALGVVGGPPSARPAGPVVARVDTPREAALAGAEIFGAAGVAPQAEPLAEVVRGAAAGYAGWWREGAAGQALVAEVDAGCGPRDAVGLASAALRRHPQGCVRSGRGHGVSTVPAVAEAPEDPYRGGRDRGLPNRGATTGPLLSSLPSPSVLATMISLLLPLPASAARGRRAATFSGSGVIRSFGVHSSTAQRTSSSSRRRVGGVAAHHDDIFPAEISRPASASMRRICADFFALGVQEAVAAPGEPLRLLPAVALAGGVAMFYVGDVAYRWRDHHQLATGRLVAAVGAASLIPVAVVAPALEALAGLTLICLLHTSWELWHHPAIGPVDDS